MKLSDKITMARNGLLYNNPYDMLERGIHIPLTTALGYGNGVQIGQGLGFDEQSQQNLGYASGFNNLLNSSASFIDTVRENKEAKKVAKRAELDEYFRVPQERYTYNDFSTTPFQTSYFKKGGKKEYQNGGILPAPTYNLPNKKESNQTILDKINKLALQKKSYDEIIAGIDNDLLVRDSIPLENQQFYNPTTEEERMKTIGFQQGGIVNQNQINVQSQLGYSTGSPFIAEPFLDINTSQGKIDMSNTGMPLYAVDNTGYSKVLPPYSGTHQFKGNKVREYKFQDGGLVTFQQKADKWGLSLKGYAELVLTAPKGKFSQDIIKIAKQFSTKKFQDGGEVEEPDFYNDDNIEEEIWNADEVMTSSTTEIDPFVSGQGVELNIDDIDFSKFVPEMQSPAAQNIPQGGTIAVSHYNPANIKYGEFAKKYGATPGRNSTDGNKSPFAVFPSYEVGLQAKKDLLFKGKNYINLSVEDAMRRWSNEGYGGEIYPEIKNKKISELTTAEQHELTRRQIKREDGQMFKILTAQNLI